MKHLLRTSVTFILAFLFAVLVTKTLGVIRTKETKKISAPLSYCDLIKSPEAFDKKLLTVSGEIWRDSKGNLYLSDSKCELLNSNTTNLDNDRLWTSKQAWTLVVALQEFNRADGRPYKIKRVNATVTGHFDAYLSQGCWGESRYRLVITDTNQTSEIRVDDKEVIE